MKNNIQTAVILAAGRGSRMQEDGGEAVRVSDEARRLADRGLKGLIPIAGRPFLDYIVERLCGAGMKKICFVISPGSSEMRDYGRRVSADFDVEVAFAVQKTKKGTADAVSASEGVVGTESFLLCGSDNIHPPDALRKLAAMPEGGFGVAGFDKGILLERSNFDSERISSFSVLNINEDGRLIEVVEKPQEPQKYEFDGKLWVGMNLYRFTPLIFDACRQIPPNKKRGEFELTDAVSYLIAKRSVEFNIVFSRGPVLDMTGREDIESVERALNSSVDNL